jgi:ribonuclease-3
LAPNNRVPEGRNGSRKSALEALMAKGSKSTPMWCARVIVDGELVGAGRGNTKKIARNEAAKQGLEKLGVSLGR